MRILHAASECIPLIKTGGLADVLGALPAAQARLGHEVRILLPAYRGTAARLGELRDLGSMSVRGLRFRVLEGRLDAAVVWLLDCPPLYDRDGDPYHDAQGRPHPDNPLRFAGFSEAAARLALGELSGARADVVHAHDWQAGPLLAQLADSRERDGPARVFTIHNLAYAGRFNGAEMATTPLPQSWWGLERGEFYRDISFLKLGITAADAITTVSPRYAEEIRTPEFGCGLDGLLRARADRLHGILNGIDEAVWNPQTDPHLARNYGTRDVAAGKRSNRAALCASLGLVQDEQALLVGLIGRFTEQKGFDLVLAAVPALLAEGLQFAILGAGERELEAAFSTLATDYPGRVGLRLGYDEGLAHRIEAGSDAFLMASRFEPCGLNQMYSQRYGTVPLVRSVGGLADTVIDATPAALADGSATGVRFEHSDPGGVQYALRRARELRQDAPIWKQMQRAGMARDFSWAGSAKRYVALYESLRRG